MTTRFNAQSKSNHGVAGLPSGYQARPTDDIVIPPVGIEDVDKALFNLFNEEIPLVVGVEGQETKRVPVVFFAGEKWALNKRLKALKDRNGTIILPLITAVRTSISQDPTHDIAGRGINQQTGEIVIHRRLDKSDRAYQGLINRLLLNHQKNAAVPAGAGDDGQLTTLRSIGDLADDPVVQQGGLMVPDRKSNVYETIVIPAPQFFTAQYEVTFWTQYTAHMNQMIEAMIASKLPQGSCWKLDTPKGYWFIASIDADTFTADLNSDDYSAEERLIRYKFVIKVPGYILASAVPGSPVPIRRYVSSPSISFSTGLPTDVESGDSGADDPFLGADDPTLPLDPEGRKPRRRDQRQVNATPLLTDPAGDPATKSLPRGTSAPQFKKVTGYDKNGKLVTRLYRVKNVNRFTGETVLAPGAGLEGLTIVVTDD